jgi:tyrosyl-tRNA synthetase
MSSDQTGVDKAPPFGDRTSSSRSDASRPSEPEDSQSEQQGLALMLRCDERELRTIIPTLLLARRQLDLQVLTPTEQLRLLKSKAADVLPESEVLAKLTESKLTGCPLVIKFGVDATGRELHVGHAVPMIMAGRFQRMGHQVVMLIGDFTARIGDPSGRVTDRPPLSEEQIRDNVQSYLEQFAPFVDISKARVVYNSEWLDRMSLKDGFALFSRLGISETLQREDFRERVSTGGRVTQAETLYADLMGIDSVRVHADIEIGGADQLLNFHTCRKVMEIFNLPPEGIVTTPLIPGISGSTTKMSKSLGNYVGLLEDAPAMFGKIMSMPDDAMEIYMKCLTEIRESEWDVLGRRMRESELNPKSVKEALALTLVGMIRGLDEANVAAEQFDQRFAKQSYKDIEGIPILSVSSDMSILDMLYEHSVVASKSEARRLINGGAVSSVSVEDSSVIRINSPSFTLAEIGAPTFILKVGKLKLFKVTVRDGG